MKSWLLRIAVGVVLATGGGMALVFLALLGLVFPLEFVVTLTTGWLTFLFRVLPQVKVDVGATGLGCGAFVIFVVGLHALLRHFHASAQVESPQRWRFRWTISASCIILLMFIAGVAFVGITHQAIWLLTSPEPIVHTPGWKISPQDVEAHSTPAGD